MTIKTPHWKENQFIGMSDPYRSGFYPYPESRSRSDVAARKKYTKREWKDAQIKAMAKRSMQLCSSSVYPDPKEFYGVEYPLGLVSRWNNSRSILEMKAKYRESCAGRTKIFFDHEIELMLPGTIDRPDLDVGLNLLSRMKNATKITLVSLLESSLFLGKNFPDNKMEWLEGCNSSHCTPLLDAIMDLDDERGAMAIMDRNRNRTSEDGISSWFIPDAVKMRVVDGVMHVPPKPFIHGQIYPPLGDWHPLGMIHAFLGNSDADKNVLLHINEKILQESPDKKFAKEVLRNSTVMLFSLIKDGNVDVEEKMFDSTWGKGSDGEPVATRDARQNMFITEYPDRMSISCNSMDLVRNELKGKTGLNEGMKRFRDKINRKYGRECT